MKPKLNKLITLLLLLSTLSFLMEVEERVSSVAQEELSKWASLLSTPEKKDPKIGSINPYAQEVSVSETLLNHLNVKNATHIN